MEINRKNIRILSLSGSRGACAKGLEEVFEQDEQAILMTADLGEFTGITPIHEKYPERYFNLGIAEQNMIGVAAGMAKDGWHVYATTYANFLTMRAYEQIRINMGYMKLPVKLIGSSGGLGMEVLGNTHYAIEDMALMRAIPGMTIISPADGLETVKAIQAVSNYNKPVYIRLTGEMNQPVIYKEDYGFQIGKTVVLKEGEDITIFATGSMVYQALQVSKLLEEKNIFAKVVNVHTIKPLDSDEIYKHVQGKKLIVTIEEHSIVGGLGSAILEVLATFEMPPTLLCGIPDKFLKVGSYPYLLEQCGLGVNQILQRIIDSMSCERWKNDTI